MTQDPTPWTTAIALAITETFSWGVLYYTFPVLALPMASDLGTSPSRLAGALSVALVVSGLAAPAVGRWIDHHGARGLMTVGAALGSLSMLAVATAESVAALYVVYAAVGIAMSMTLYEPAMAVVAHYLEAMKGKALLVITVTAALASTIFSPATAALDGRYGWRTTVVALGLLLAIVTVPLHAVALSPRPPSATEPFAGRGTDRSRPVASMAGFRLVTGAFVIEKAVATAVTAHVVMFLVERGETLAYAAGAAGLIGVSKILGRVLVTLVSRRRPVLTVTAGLLGVQAATLAVPLVDCSRTITTGLLIAGFGATSGAATVVWPLVVIERFGTSSFGLLSGTAAFAGTVPRAVAPGALGLLAAAVGSYTIPWLTLVGLVLTAAVCVTAADARSMSPVAGPP